MRSLQCLPSSSKEKANDEGARGVRGGDVIRKANRSRRARFDVSEIEIDEIVSQDLYPNCFPL